MRLMKNGLIFFMGLLVGIILTAIAAAGLGIAYYSDSAAESETVEEEGDAVAQSEAVEQDAESVAESETVEEKGDSEAKEEKDTGITYAEEWTEFMVARKFKVVKVLEDGAMAKCEDPDPFRSISDIERPSTFYGPEVYIMTSGKNLFYDDQIVEVPAGQKAMQIGTWRFRKYSSEKVVPVIVFK